ncbi:MAG: hypothetical protein AAGA48_32900 [Myxococcota bacterium]
MNPLLRRLVEGYEGLVGHLVGQPTAELTALWLEVAKERAAGRTPAEVLRAFLRDGYVQPAPVDARALRRAELASLDVAEAFEAIELSPLAPLGSCSTFSLGGQNRVFSAARNLEVLADPTNVLALECARRRRAGQTGILDLCTVGRLVRCQPLKSEAHTRHFSMFAAVTAGRDKDARRFALKTFTRHLTLQRDLHVRLAQDRDAAAVRLELFNTPPFQAVANALHDQFKGTFPQIDRLPLEQAYYSGIRYRVWMRFGEETLPISDGGYFDWLQTLCSDRKEHFVASALGTELVTRKQP